MGIPNPPFSQDLTYTLILITEKYVESVSSQAATGQSAEGGNNEWDGEGGKWK